MSWIPQPIDNSFTSDIIITEGFLYMTRVGIFSITVVFLIMVALTAGTVGYVAPGPIEVRDWYDLDAIRDNLGGSYLLTNDLDSTTAGYEELASETANQGKGWQPIGAFITNYGYRGFDGILDGQGYEIRDLFINRPDEDAVGLFCHVQREGVIKNIGMVNVTVIGRMRVGGLVGLNGDGNVSNSYATGSVSGSIDVGGLVGLNDGTVSNSYSTGSVTGDAGIGGLVGNGGPTVINSFWDIETSGQAASAGGTGKTTAEMQDMATFSGAAWEICVVPPGATNPTYTWNIVDGVTYPFLSWQPVSTPQNQQPIEITSVLGPLQPFNPAGPVVEITLKNVAVEPVISLTATLEVNRSFDFAFNVTPSNPLQPDGSTSETRTLIGGGFIGGNVSYPLTINATLQNGAQFVYIKLVQIVEP